MSQESFDFNFASELREDDFVVSSCNSYAFSFVKKWPDWGSHALLIYGPKASGKSHLAGIWQRRASASILSAEDVYEKSVSDMVASSKAFILEDIERVHDEVALLHFFNAVGEEGGYLLMSASAHPSNLGVRLPDLRSRFNSVPCVGLGIPDEELLRTLFIKHFSDRQLRVGMDVINFLAVRVERSFSNVEKVVDMIDREALKSKRNITISFVKKILG